MPRKRSSVSPVRSQGVFGCENCREQHLKCDRVTPVCGRCQNTGRQCRRAGLRVRETKAKYAKTQKWVKISRRLVFIYETNFTRSPSPEYYMEVGSSDSPETVTDNQSRHDSLPSPLYPPMITQSPISHIPTKLFIPKNYHVPYGPFTPEQAHCSDSKRPLHPDECSPDIHAAQGRKGLSPSDRFLSQPTHLEHSVYPLLEWKPDQKEQHRLVRHFVQHIATWLDLCDPNHSFQTIVPQRAGRCPILMQAICALAGHHLAHVDKTFSPNSYVKYDQECVININRWYENTKNIVDEDIFATMVIMRVFAELKAKDDGSGRLNEYFLSGLQLFAVKSKDQLNHGSLGAAAFWVGLRQEIYNAVANRTQVGMLQMGNVPSLVDRSLKPADDFTWANRAVVHCADVINFCFAKEQGTFEEWDELMKWNRRWSSEAALSFTPIYLGDEVDEANRRVPFPAIGYIQRCHVIGTQHHLLATLFLKRHEPRRPLGHSPGHEAHLQKELELEQQARVRRICGIGLGNSWTPPSMFTACMAIHAFGSLFRDRHDQIAMMQLLKQTEKEHGRPTATVQEEMALGVWGWSRVPEDFVKVEEKKLRLRN